MGRDRHNSEGEDIDLAQRAGQPLPRRSVKKTVAAAVILFTVGSLMLYFGVGELYRDRDKAIAMLVTGSIAFLPGAYACTVIVGTLLRWPGYDVEDLPSYDND